MIGEDVSVVCLGSILSYTLLDVRDRRKPYFEYLERKLLHSSHIYDGFVRRISVYFLCLDRLPPAVIALLEPQPTPPAILHHGVE